MNSVALRMDDPGASSKRYELYGKDYLRLGRMKLPFPAAITNFLFLKRIPLWSGWAPYEELTSYQWDEIFGLISRHSARLTVAVTASWVEEDGTLVPYPEKFPQAAAALKRAVRAGLLEVANHGLTHCIVGQHRPRLFSSNQQYHREFTEMLPRRDHLTHLRDSQQILETWLGEKVVTFVPPGNTFTESTITAAAQCGIKYINCSATTRIAGDIVILSNEGVLDFHDRDVVLNGHDWLERLISKGHGAEFVFVRELGETRRRSLEQGSC
jgi:peptidoglycan/xylan/chitin deacetylase (PgdA/CDA1 family)